MTIWSLRLHATNLLNVSPNPLRVAPFRGCLSTSRQQLRTPNAHTTNIRFNTATWPPEPNDDSAWDGCLSFLALGCSPRVYDSFRARQDRILGKGGRAMGGRAFCCADQVGGRYVAI